MRLRSKVCSDPKYLSWVSWSLLANNPVNKMMYLIFCGLDLVIIFVYALILVQRAHFGNFNMPFLMEEMSKNSNKTLIEIYQEEVKWLETSNKTKEYTSVGIQLSFIRQVDFELFSLIYQNSNLLLYFTISVFAFCVFILGALLILSLIVKNHADLDKPNFVKKCLCLILVAVLTFLHMPIFDLVVRNIVATFYNEHTLQIALLRYLISAAAICGLATLMLYLIRIFNISVPSELVPWCAPISKLAFLNMFIKACLVISVTFDLEGKYAVVEIIILFIAQSFQASYRVLFAPNYLKEVDIFVKTKDFLICLIFFIGIICKILGDQSNYDLVYFILFAPIVTFGWMIYESHRKQMILLKVKSKQVKLEIEYEYALYIMMTLVRDCMQENVDSQKVFGQLMDVVLAHIEDCDDQLCICDEMESFYELLRLKQLHNQEIFPLLRHERRRYKKIIDDQGLIGTVSNITDLTLKQNSTESTFTKSGQGDKNDDKLERNAEGDEIEEDTKKQRGKKGSLPSKKNRSVYKINIDEVKHRFLSELLYLFYFEIIRKYPDSYKIQLLSNYFSLEYKKKEMLCIFQMRSFVKQRLSKLDQYCHCINEQYLLWEINKVQKINMHSSSNQQDGNFNGEYFITMNKLYQQFNQCIEALSGNVVSFWKMLDRPQIDTEITYMKGSEIARNIQETFRVFNELDTIKIFKDYQMYFQFAILQLHILNDPVAYELYIGKMKSILEINKVYQKNFSNDDSKNSDLTNFIIVDANGTKFGQIIQVNNSLRMLLGWSEEEILRNRIETFMPQLIRQKHPEFMNRYNKTGQSYIINNKVTMFIKKANGYVIPVELYIKFHYSIDYQYTFLAIIKPFYEMAPFGNGLKYNTEQLLFLIVDNEETDGRITEYSESCVKLLGNYGFSEELERNGITKHITDIIFDFDFEKIRRSRQERYVTNQIYENVHTIDLNQFSENHSLNFVVGGGFGRCPSNATGGGQAISLNQTGFMNAKTRIFEERYSGGVLDLNIFCFAFINENEYMTNSSYLGSTVQSKAKTGTSQSIKPQKKKIKEEDTLKQQFDEINNHDLEIVRERENESHSASASPSTYSQNTSTTSMAEFRNFHSFTEQATPKTLMLIIKMIGALYFIMVTIASVNLAINIRRQMQSERDVQTVRQSFDRMNSVSMNQLLARVLLNIANGYELENSTLISNRFNEYLDLQRIKIQELKDTQSMLQQSTFETSADFESFMRGKNVPLYYINERNQPYIQYESLNVALNLFIAKLNEINSYKKENFKGNLQIQTLTPKLGQDYRPTQIEQTLYFVVQNGNKELRQFSINANDYYSRESENHAEQNIVSTKLTAIISIIVIVVIGLIIAPVLTKAEIRKYKALLYFLKIPKKQFAILIKNCEYCLNMNDESRYFQIMKDYEIFLGVKLINQQVHQLRQAKSQQSNLEAQNSRSGGGTAGLSSGMRSSDFYSSGSDRMGSIENSRIGNRNAIFKTGEIIEEGGTVNNSNEQKLLDIEGSAMESINSGNSRGGGLSSLKQSSGKNRQNSQEIEMMQEQMQDEDDNNQQDVKEEVKNTNKLNLANLNLKRKRKGEINGNRSKKARFLGDEQNNSESEDEKEVKDGDETDKSEMRQKIRLINAQAYKRRSTMVFSSLSVILVLSTYFLIAYFLAIRTFETAAIVIQSLESVFYKGSCFDSAMNFLRESQIRNESMTIKTGFNTDIGFKAQKEVLATDYYLEFCFNKEADYNKMRIDLPPYFRSMSDYFKVIESDQFCESIYSGKHASLKPTCKNGLNGIMSKGLTNAFFHMFNQILKANLEFTSLGATSLRNISFLQQEMLKQTLIQIIDLKAQVLDHALDELKQKTMESVIKYIQKLLNDFIMAYVIFVSILTLAVAVLILLGFKVLRRSMWETNILLKIIPFEMLPKADRIDIKDFFNS